MTNAQLKLATLREAHRRKLIEKAYDYLRHSGIPVAGGQPLEQPDPNLLPLYVAITIEGGSGIVYDGEPTWRNLYYSVTFRRRLFSSAAATFPITAKLELAYPVSESLSGTVGPTSPETLEKRQEEALGKACEAIVAHWKYDNPAPNGKP